MEEVMAQENAGDHGKNRGAKSAEPAAAPAAAPVPAHESSNTNVIPAVERHDGQNTLASKAATVAIVGIGAALIEAELIPGILIGVAAMVAPNVLPKVGQGLRPLIKGMVRAGYSLTERARESFAEAGEQIQDIVAEVRSEQHAMPHGGVPAGGAADNGRAPEHA